MFLWDLCFLVLSFPVSLPLLPFPSYSSESLFPPLLSFLLRTCFLFLPSRLFFSLWGAHGVPCVPAAGGGSRGERPGDAGLSLVKSRSTRPTHVIQHSWLWVHVSPVRKTPLFQESIEKLGKLWLKTAAHIWDFFLLMSRLSGFILLKVDHILDNKHTLGYSPPNKKRKAAHETEHELSTNSFVKGLDDSTVTELQTSHLHTDWKFQCSVEGCFSKNQSLSFH